MKTDREIGQHYAATGARRVLRAIAWLFFPPARMTGCTPPSEAQRLAEYEIRMGKHRAEQRLRDERVAQLLDQRATVRPKFSPKLPEDRKVVSIRRRRVA